MTPPRVMLLPPVRVVTAPDEPLMEPITKAMLDGVDPEEARLIILGSAIATVKAGRMTPMMGQYCKLRDGRYIADDTILGSMQPVKVAHLEGCEACLIGGLFVGMAHVSPDGSLETRGRETVWAPDMRGYLARYFDPFQLGMVECAFEETCTHYDPGMWKANFIPTLDYMMPLPVWGWGVDDHINPERQREELWGHLREDMSYDCHNDGTAEDLAITSLLDEVPIEVRDSMSLFIDASTWRAEWGLGECEDDEDSRDTDEDALLGIMGNMYMNEGCFNPNQGPSFIG